MPTKDNKSINKYVAAEHGLSTYKILDKQSLKGRPKEYTGICKGNKKMKGCGKDLNYTNPGPFCGSCKLKISLSHPGFFKQVKETRKWVRQKDKPVAVPVDIPIFSRNRWCARKKCKKRLNIYNSGIICVPGQCIDQKAKFILLQRLCNILKNLVENYNVGDTSSPH